MKRRFQLTLLTINRKKTTKLLTTLFFLTWLASAQIPNSNTIFYETNPKWKTFEVTNYLIQYPSEWKLNQSGLMESTFILFSPLESSQDQFRENVNLLIQDLSSSNLDLDLYAEISEGQLKKMINNSRLIESKRIKTESEEYHRMIYTGDQGNYHLKFEQYFWVRNGKAFVLTLTCEESKFAVYKGIGEAILNSFEFKK